MPAAAALLIQLGGVAGLDELRRGGVVARAVQRSCAAGEIIRIRRGLYASASLDSRILRGLWAGGSLTCVSGCGFHGLWQPPGTALHLGVLHRASRLVHPETAFALVAGSSNVVVHWSARSSPAVTRGVLPLVDCLLEVMRCQPEDFAFAVLESALHSGRVSRAERQRLVSRVSASKRRLVEDAGSVADSGSESLFRYRMLRLGVLMQSQVEIAGVGRVDFVIGDRLIVEIDSNSHHSGLAQRLRDLDRDAIATGLGYISLRFDYDQVLNDWETVESTVLAVIARGEHLVARPA